MSLEVWFLYFAVFVLLALNVLTNWRCSLLAKMIDILDERTQLPPRT